MPSSTTASKYVCIHGHFYQPPRENAWLEVIEVQDSAHPYHDWNERITAECYEPNATARILDQENIIRDIVNNYSRISFNFGPTLLSWMETYAPETYEAILEADKESIKRFKGHGSAIAQVYNHIIMPLANERDKQTQIAWGIRDFEFRFKRKPEGMWLAETAVDIKTLEALAENNIKFTILAPRQAKAVRKIGETEWTSVNDRSVNTKQSYLCKLPSGKSIYIFFYDGDISQSIAFNGLLNDGRHFADSLLNAIDPNNKEAQLVHVATDGETYGHHHKHGDMALAFCLDFIEKEKSINLTNYGQFLSLVPTTYEAQIHENSSWSCVHGVERWRNDCGCNSGGKPGWNQQWRRPLRDALDWLRDQANEIVEREGKKIFRDTLAAKNDYINVVLNRNDDTIKKFIKSNIIDTAQSSDVLRLMEMQRHAMLMYTSCGWFFDEVSGIETTQILQYACRVIQLASQTGNVNLEPEFLERLEKAPSNVSAHRNAAEVYKKFVLPALTNLKRVGMHYAVSSIFDDEPEALTIFNYKTYSESFIKKEAGDQKLALGITRVKSLVTLSEKKFTFAVICLGKHNIIGNISLDMGPDNFASMQFRMVKAFEEGRLGDVIGLMQSYFGSEKYTIWQLFSDEKRKVLELIAKESLFELENSLRKSYNSDYQLITALSNNDIPIPNAYRTAFEYVLNADLTNCFLSDRINIKAMERISSELDRWSLKIEDLDKLSKLAGESIFKELKRIASERENVKRIQRLNRMFPLLKKFGLKPNLHKSQNYYFQISREARKTDNEDEIQWNEQLKLLGENLNVKVL
ncbi:MAG TPA: glycoside hydrolase [Cytophagales bacterium]|jgi:alpha-amylase/alpha-mannosidase (GH57 family)|nr:glycoside hydrolase [Cytophagales bacterium]